MHPIELTAKGTETIKHEWHLIDNEILRQCEKLNESLTTPKHLVINQEILVTILNGPNLTRGSTPVSKVLTYRGLIVTILPWFKGILVLPELVGEDYAERKTF